MQFSTKKGRIGTQTGQTSSECVLLVRFFCRFINQKKVTAENDWGKNSTWKLKMYSSQKFKSSWLHRGPNLFKSDDSISRYLIFI